MAPAAQAFAPFADPLIFLFIGTFMLARAIFFHGLDRRFAFAILGLRGAYDRSALGFGVDEFRRVLNSGVHLLAQLYHALLPLLPNEFARYLPE